MICLRTEWVDLHAVSNRNGSGKGQWVQSCTCCADWLLAVHAGIALIAYTRILQVAFHTAAMCARVRAAFLYFRIATQATETFIARAGIGQESVLASTVDTWITGALVDANGARRACVVVFTVARIRTV